MNEIIALGPEGKQSNKLIYRTGNNVKIYSIAVTSNQGNLVDQSLGEAGEFLIYHCINDSFTLAELRSVQNYGEHSNSFHEKTGVIRLLADCDALLTRGIGRVLQKKLLRKGVLVLEYCYTVDSGLSYAVAQLDMKNVI